MRPRIGLTKFPEIREKTSTSIDPSFLWAALLYRSQEPTKQTRPAMLPHTRIMLLNAGTMSIATLPAMKAVSSVVIPASSDSAKAAVGFGATFTAKAYPYYKDWHGNYQPIVTLEGEEYMRFPLCNGKEATKQSPKRSF